MGLRSRLSRKKRRAQRTRAGRRRREGLVKARPLCQGCGSALTCDERAGLDIWSCGACRKTFLRAGPAWLVELDAVVAREQTFTVAEFLRKAA